MSLRATLANILWRATSSWWSVALGSEAALRFLLDGHKESYSFTLRDLSVNREP